MMEISGRILSRHEDAKYIAESLSADNLLSMETTADENNVICKVRGDKLRSVIASVDDYLMNLSVAEDICNMGYKTKESGKDYGKNEKKEVN